MGDGRVAANSRKAAVQKRRGRYMAQALEAFETRIQPHMPKAAAGDIQDFKGMLRERFNALADDAIDILGTDSAQNGVAQEIRDQLSPTGRP